MEEVNQNLLFEESESLQGKATRTISATQMKFVSTKDMTIDELFSGFQNLRVITYSYTIPFIEKIMKLFSTGEVIIGTEHNITQGAAELFATQQVATNAVTKNKYLQERIKNGEFRFYVTNEVTSHQKLYLLSNEDGKVRTIFGSANMSYTAWQTSQIEDYFFCDDSAFYDLYLEKFNALKDVSSSEIAKEAAPISLEVNDIKELPVAKKVTHGAVVVVEQPSSEETEYVFNVNKLTSEYKQSLDSVKQLPTSKLDGKTYIDSNVFKKMCTATEKQIAFRERTVVENPSLVLDFSNQTATFDNVQFLLEPDKEEVRENIIRFCDYMESFNSFTKDTKKLKQSYWKVLNYMFLSPFLAHLRLNAMYFDYDLRFLPMYLFICGDSDAGKTTFVQTVQHLMLNKDINKLTQNVFSGEKMANLKVYVKGTPILIDEMTSTYWRYVDDIVKTDDSFILKNKLGNHPTFIFTSNKIRTLKPDISKRVILVRVDNRVNKTSAAYNSRTVNLSRKNLTNAFYRLYLAKMFDEVAKLVDKMEEFSAKNDKTWFPDIFSVSSNVIHQIFASLDLAIPDEFPIFSWEDYMGDLIISEKATQLLLDEYEYSPQMFSINKKRNELVLDLSFYDQREMMQRKNTLIDELPADFECKESGNKVIMRLDKVKEHINFAWQEKGFFAKLKDKLFG